MTLLTYILLAVIVAVVLIDLYLKRKNKLATTKEIEKVIDKENPDKKGFNKPIAIITATLLLLIGLFFSVNHQLYDGKLTDTDDGITVLQNITLDKISSADIVGNDSMWVIKENMQIVSGIIIDSMGNYNGVILNGLKQGKWRYFYPNSRKLAEVYYIDGYYGNELMDERFWDSNLDEKENENVPLSIISEVGLNSKCLFWYINGQLLKAQNYKDGKRFENGVYKEWYYNGKLKLEQEFQDGKAQGLYREWYSDQLTDKGHYLDGKKDGLWKQFASGGGTYAKGAIYNECVYSKGKFLSRKEYHNNGDLKSEQIWDDNCSAIEKSWHDNGQLKGIVHYKYDCKINDLEVAGSGSVREDFRRLNMRFPNSRHGIERYWDRDGLLEHETNWRNGKRHGLSRFWFDGELAYKVIYKDGKKIYYKKYKYNFEDLVF